MDSIFTCTFCNGNFVYIREGEGEGKLVEKRIDDVSERGWWTVCDACYDQIMLPRQAAGTCVGGFTNPYKSLAVEGILPDEGGLKDLIDWDLKNPFDLMAAEQPGSSIIEEVPLASEIAFNPKQSCVITSVGVNRDKVYLIPRKLCEVITTNGMRKLNFELEFAICNYLLEHSDVRLQDLVVERHVGVSHFYIVVRVKDGEEIVRVPEIKGISEEG